MLIPEDNVIGYDVNILKFKECRHKYLLQLKTEFQWLQKFLIFLNASVRRL